MNINYTITGKKDGFGAQYLAIMSGIAYCKYKNYNYVHTPINIIGRWNKVDIKKINDMIGLKESNDKIDIKELYSKEVLFSENPDLYYTKEVISFIKSKYYLNNNIDNNIDNNINNIVIHIRRGDVSSKNHIERFTSNNEYLKIIIFLRNIYYNEKIIIYSEGKIADFNELLEQKNIEFHLNKSVQETFNGLVSAKILVTAKSAFSYAAALLNSNTIYYMNYMHKPLKHWNILKY